ncbi:MAG: hypothetical protein J1F41_06855, partial [Lachnospiraceae bacterium]|nr:hypothetical protein [Lachnospiraceae bacterium]
MRMMKRWIALMLAMAVVISDCGGITVFAAENATEVDNELISEDETIESEDADVSPEDESNEADEKTNLVDEDADLMDEDTDSDTDTETEFPALHIGQIKEGEELPSPDDSKFVYDLP